MPLLGSLSDTGAQTTTVDPLPVNVSPIDLHTLLYSGYTTRTIAEYQPWWYNVTPYNGHKNIGMNASNSAQILYQAQTMKSEGFDVVVVDYYGCSTSCPTPQSSSQAYNLSVTTALASAINSNPSTTPNFMIMLDNGSVDGSGTGQCPPASGDQSSCLIAAFDTQMDYVANHWLYQSYYEVNAKNSHPIVMYFVTKSNWPDTNFSTVFAAVTAHTTSGQSCGVGCTYTATVDYLDQSDGAFGESGIMGGYVWPQPNDYTSAAQFYWDGDGSYDYIGGVYSAAQAQTTSVPNTITVGGIYKGFDDHNASWGSNRVIAQQCGQVLNLTAAKISSSGYSSSKQLQYVMVDTWNDYEEGTEVETGVGNCITISQPAISGSTISWSLIKSDATYASANTISKFQIWTGTGTPTTLYTDNISASATSSTAPTLSAGQSVWVYMVGKPFIQNQLSPALGASTNYYVNASSGSDSNNCLSSGAACKTVAHAESLMAAGDTLHFAAGTYRITNGSSGSYTSLGGQIVAKSNQTFIGPSCTPTSAPCTAILSGSVQLTSGQILGPDADGNYYATGFTQHGNNAGYTCDTGWAGCNYTEDLYVNGTPYQHLNLSSEATLSAGTWWLNYSTDTAYFPSALTPTFVSGNTVEISVVGTAFAASAAASGVTVEYLTVEEFASQLNNGGAIDADYAGTSSSTSAINWLVENNYVTLNHGLGIRAGFGMQILNNVSTNNGEFGIGGGLPAGTGVIPSGLVVQGNTVTYNNYAHVSPGFGAGGMKLGNTAYATVRGNIISNNIGQGIHFDTNSICPLIDGNTVLSNVDLAGTGSSSLGIEIEISNQGSSGCEGLVRNNIIKYNGESATTGPNYQIEVSSTNDIQAYCNVSETDSSSVHMQHYVMGASDRGDNTEAPGVGDYITTVSNYFHHNTFIWDSTSSSTVGYAQGDTANQPNFFANNTPPDYNMYHLANTSSAYFIYDNNNSGTNTDKTFTNYQAAGADTHGTIDTIYTSGFPTVTITSPADQSTFSNSVTIGATASDGSGIASAQLYEDWNLISTISGAGPYSFSVSGVSQGVHVFAVYAIANSGVQSCWAVTLTQTQSSAIVPQFFAGMGKIGGKFSLGN